MFGIRHGLVYRPAGYRQEEKNHRQQDIYPQNSGKRQAEGCPLQTLHRPGILSVVTPKGGKLWRYDYRLNGRRKTASLGSFPDVSLKDAADKQVEFRKLIARGIDPIGEKKRVRAQAVQDAVEQARTFEVVAREWFGKRMAGKSPRYQHQILSRLENHLFPFIGASPIAELETKDFLAALRVTEARGALEMAHRLAQLVNQVCRYA